MTRQHFYLFLLLAGIAMLACSCAAWGGSGTVATFAAAGTAGVDATLGSLVQNKAIDPSAATSFSGWAHALADSVTSIAQIPAKFEALKASHDALAQQTAAASASLPYQLASAGAGGAATAVGSVRMLRGAPTPAHVKSIAAVAKTA